MSKANIFDLKKLIPGGAKKSEPYVHVYSAGVNSDSEKNALLEHYKPVEKESWDKIPIGTHVRYENAEGDFKRGGFIAHHYVSTKDETKDHKMIRLMSTPNKGGGKEWSIDTTNITQIWKNGKFEPKPTTTDVVGELKAKIESLSAQFDQLRVDLAHVSNEQKRTIALIKKLHNIQV